VLLSYSRLLFWVCLPATSVSQSDIAGGPEMLMLEEKAGHSTATILVHVFSLSRAGCFNAILRAVELERFRTSGQCFGQEC
jgi:hypothetical protein